MKKYYVEVPVTMKLIVSGVEAESEQDAIDKVKSSEMYFNIVDAEDANAVDYEWEMHDQIVQGNVFCGLINEAWAEEEEEEEE